MIAIVARLAFYIYLLYFYLNFSAHWKPFYFRLRSTFILRPIVPFVVSANNGFQPVRTLVNEDVFFPV